MDVLFTRASTLAQLTHLCFGMVFDSDWCFECRLVVSQSLGFGSYDFRCPSATCFGVVLVNLPDEDRGADSEHRATSIPLNRFVDLETFHEMLRPLVRGFAPRADHGHTAARDGQVGGSDHGGGGANSPPRGKGGAVKKNNIFQNLALVMKLRKIAKRTAKPCRDPRTGRSVGTRPE